MLFLCLDDCFLVIALCFSGRTELSRWELQKKARLPRRTVRSDPLHAPSSMWVSRSSWARAFGTTCAPPRTFPSPGPRRSHCKARSAAAACDLFVREVQAAGRERERLERKMRAHFPRLLFLQCGLPLTRRARVYPVRTERKSDCAFESYGKPRRAPRTRPRRFGTGAASPPYSTHQ